MKKLIFTILLFLSTWLSAQDELTIKMLIDKFDIERNELETKFTLIGNSPHRDQIRIILIPEIIEKKIDEFWIADLHVFVLNDSNKNISKTILKSAIQSDAIELKKIEIMDMPYCFSLENYGFGIKFTYQNTSRAANQTKEKCILVEYGNNFISQLFEIELIDEIRYTGLMGCENTEIIKTEKNIEEFVEVKDSSYEEVKVVSKYSKYKLDEKCEEHEFERVVNFEIYQMKNNSYQIKQ